MRELLSIFVLAGCSLLVACAGNPARTGEVFSGSSGVSTQSAEVPVAAVTESPSAATPGPTGDPTEPLPWEVEEEETYDPFESFNRKVDAFNQMLDRNILKPVARGYSKIVPERVRSSIGNFFRNLFEPTVIINDLLQGKFAQAGSDTGRFIANSTFGILGLFDVATGWGMPRHNEDLGQTLGVWGVGDGPYIVLPFFGPRNLRDTVGFVGDWYTDPVTYVEDDVERWGTRGVYYVDLRSQYLGASDVLTQATDDEYLFYREAYRQRRKSQVNEPETPAQPALQ